MLRSSPKSLRTVFRASGLSSPTKAAVDAVSVVFEVVSPPPLSPYRAAVIMKKLSISLLNSPPEYNSLKDYCLDSCFL